MWTREMIKTKAKKSLVNSYWKAFFVSLILCLLSGGLSFRFNLPNNLQNSFRSPAQSFDFKNFVMPDFSGYQFATFIKIFVPIIIAVIIFAIAFHILIRNPLTVGGMKYFISSTDYKFDFKEMGYAFDGVRYDGIVKAMLWKNFLLFCWALLAILPIIIFLLACIIIARISGGEIINAAFGFSFMLAFLALLLLLIPFIIKSYSYIMVPYILADNPNIGSKRAIEISTLLTDGQKWNIFVLQLSFIGLYILGALCWFVGSFFVAPYYFAAFAQLYVTLRQNAFEIGALKHEDFLLERPLAKPEAEPTVQLDTEAKAQDNAEDILNNEDNNSENRNGE